MAGRTGTKLIAVGDGEQLPSIGSGGMFDRLTQHAPVVELETIHRTKDPDEQKAWQALRAGEPERAMAHYQARGRLHLAARATRQHAHSTSAPNAANSAPTNSPSPASITDYAKAITSHSSPSIGRTDRGAEAARRT